MYGAEEMYIWLTREGQLGKEMAEEISTIIRACESVSSLIVAQAAKGGKLSYHEAYQLTGLYGSTFDKYVAAVEMGA